MNWMQAYEVLACGALFFACVAFNLVLHDMPRVARMCTALLGLSALVRGAALIAKFAGMPNLSSDTIAAADGNIPLFTAVVLASIVWHQIKSRIDYACGHSSDAR